MKIAILPGDGIGPEIVAQAVKVLHVLGESFELETAPVGGAGYAAHGHPLPDATLAGESGDAVLFGAVGDYKYDNRRPVPSRAGDFGPCARTGPVRQPASGHSVSEMRAPSTLSRKWCPAWIF